VSTTTIVQITDLHIRPEGVPAYRVCESNALTERALRTVARLNPDAVLITGDLTDCGLASEYQLLADMLKRHLPMPVHMIPGNHDRRSEMQAHLPGVPMTDGFFQYTTEIGPVRVVMLDTVVPGHGHGSVDGGRLEWLDRTLAEHPAQPTLVAMHHPPFICGIAHMDRIKLKESEAFAGIIAKHPQVTRIISGHHHRPIVTQVAHAIASIAPSVVNAVEFSLDPASPSAFVLEPPAFQVHTWSQTGGFVSHNVLVESFPGPYPFTLDKDYPGHS
jgi:Icc protein